MKQIESFTDFWPFYLNEHKQKDTRMLHFVGTGFSIIFVLLGIIIDPILMILAPLFGYGFAWISHFYVERNRPATFTHPWWSLLADYKMFYLMCIGRIEKELKRYNISQ